MQFLHKHKKDAILRGVYLPRENVKRNGLEFQKGQIPEKELAVFKNNICWDLPIIYPRSIMPWSVPIKNN